MSCTALRLSFRWHGFGGRNGAKRHVIPRAVNHHDDLAKGLARLASRHIRPSLGFNEPNFCRARSMAAICLVAVAVERLALFATAYVQVRCPPRSLWPRGTRVQGRVGCQIINKHRLPRRDDLPQRLQPTRKRTCWPRRDLARRRAFAKAVEPR